MIEFSMGFSIKTDKIKFKKFKNTLLLGLFEGVYLSHFDCGLYLNAEFIQGRKIFHFFPCLPLIAVLRSPHLKVYDFSEKTKPFYCPSGTKFSTKSKNLSQTTQSSCSLKSSCIGFPDGCTAFSFSTLMNKQFEVVIISLYSSEQKCNLWTIYIKIYTTELQLVSGQGGL